MNNQPVLVIGDDPLSLQMLSTLLRDKGYGNVIVGNHIEVAAELEAREARQRREEDHLIMGIGNVGLGDLFVGFPPPIDMYKLKHLVRGDFNWTYDRKPPPHYRVNFRTGKPLRY